ncbi:hypothetical protein FOMPIDRAFT_1056771 [Fomitopsis schrenkii]|uniref:Uncharacterized protein n=1 Tax=Fomitopsis schrenkii TaxID=2126942 RepID=S8ERW9_FOMSC|nr:hypothetical protein FOMPIDRAFT_1056771 [Fomitopsis schrenkii]
MVAESLASKAVLLAPQTECPLATMKGHAMLTELYLHLIPMWTWQITVLAGF